MKHQILVAEDEEDIRNTLQIVLELEGYEVISAINGLEALKLLEEGLRPQLVLLDLMMPLMNGEEFLKKKVANSDFKDVQVVLISAVSKLDAARFGVVEVVNKPVDLNALLECVGRHCGPQNHKTHELR